MNLYLIRYIDYYSDKVYEHIIEEKTEEKALEEFKKCKIKYWRIMEVKQI